MKQIKNISEIEYEAMLKFPIHIYQLAANSDSKLDETEKKSAIKFSHIKTYSSDPLLTSFYEDADKVFEKNILQRDEDLPVNAEEQIAGIKRELSDIEKIVMKLGKEYTSVMHRSMKSFTEHVSKAHHNVPVDFIFPIPIKGLTY